jgi:branched-chain amino acid transport system substrate-binding protein
MPSVVQEDQPAGSPLLLPGLQYRRIAVEGVTIGVRENTTLFNETSFAGWTSGVLLEEAMNAGGLTPSGTPRATEVKSDLYFLKNESVDGLAPSLTFIAGEPTNISCWFTARVENGTPTLTNGGQLACETNS